MANPRLILVACLALAAAPAAAQTMPAAGGGGNEPVSQVPTNLTAADTHTEWSPKLPMPPVDPNAPPAAFLKAAQDELAAGHTGMAQEALERAESRALDRSVPPSAANQPSQQPLVDQISKALHALAAGDKAGTMQMVQAAAANPDANRAE